RALITELYRSGDRKQFLPPALGTSHPEIQTLLSPSSIQAWIAHIQTWPPKLSASIAMLVIAPKTVSGTVRIVPALQPPPLIMMSGSQECARTAAFFQLRCSTTINPRDISAGKSLVGVCIAMLRTFRNA